MAYSRWAVLLGNGFCAVAVCRGRFLAVMLLAGLGLGGGGLAGGRRGLRGRCLGGQDGSHAQKRGENKFVHLVLLLRAVHFRLA